MKDEYPFYEGAVVKAIKVITECGDPKKADRNWTRENPGPDGHFHHGFVHAEEGDYGIVVHIEYIPTVRFFRTGTETIVYNDEIKFID